MFIYTKATYPMNHIPHCLELRIRQRNMSPGAFARGAHTMNSMFFKPMIRKSYHKKSSSADTLRETMKLDAEEASNKKTHIGETNSKCWVPHERTGIYYPKGQEKVMEGIPSGAGKDDIVVNWFSHNEN